MTGFLLRIAFACVCMLAVSAPPASALGRFDQHGSLQRSNVQNVHDTPEIDAAAAQSAIAIVVAGVLLLSDRRSRR